jgi:hypothetical protein
MAPLAAPQHWPLWRRYNAHQERADRGKMSVFRVCGAWLGRHGHRPRGVAVAGRLPPRPSRHRRDPAAACRLPEYCGDKFAAAYVPARGSNRPGYVTYAAFSANAKAAPCNASATCAGGPTPRSGRPRGSARRGVVAAIMRPAVDGQPQHPVRFRPRSPVLAAASWSSFGLLNSCQWQLLVIAGYMDRETTARGLAALSRELRRQLAEIRKVGPSSVISWTSCGLDGAP